MKAVISDTSPINYLVWIGRIDILPQLFGSVLIPPAVLSELRHHLAPPAVRKWLEDLPGWIQECAPQSIFPHLNLDPGETEAISLAVERTGSLLIIDEWKGREAALGQGLAITGTLGLLEEADRLQLLDFETELKKLEATNFRLHGKRLAQILVRIRSRKEGG